MYYSYVYNNNNNIVLVYTQDRYITIYIITRAVCQNYAIILLLCHIFTVRSKITDLHNNNIVWAECVT